MEAKDTLLIIPQGTEPQTTMCRHCAYMNAHAEISFRAGIREVVEWLINDSYDTTIHFGEDWQAKLKEWGIE